MDGAKIAPTKRKDSMIRMDDFIRKSLLPTNIEVITILSVKENLKIL